MSDSEESDGEGGLGNLNRLIVRPPGHSGKAKRGHLCFDAAFETGNLGRADHITELEYDLYIRPDTCRPRARFWYNFTVENVKQDQRVIFNIVNFGKDRTLYNSDMTPIVRSTSRPKWQRIPRRLVFCHRSLAHSWRRLLSIAFAFDREEDVYQFAAAPPYSYSRLQKYLTLWEKKAEGFATRESIAQTTQKRRVDLITIGSFELKPSKEDHTPALLARGRLVEPKKRVLLIIARTHGGETPTSFVCQGFLDYMVSSSEKASALREGIAIQVVPMLNPDGVFLGNQRANLLGCDLHQCWASPTKYAHPQLVAVHDRLKKIHAEKTLQLDFILDLHADVSQEGVFMHGNSYDDVYRFERHCVLPKFLAARVEAWRAELCLYNADARAAGCARRVLPSAGGDGYSLVVSMGGRRVGSRGTYMHYTEDAYTKIGRSLVKVLCDYYRHIGVIPPRQGKTSKKKENRGRKRRRRRMTDRERSPSSSPGRERRVLCGRVVSPPLPPAPPVAPPAAPYRAPPPRRRTAPHRPYTKPAVDHVLPLINGRAVRPPQLSIVDLCAYIRPSAPAPAPRRAARPRWRLARPPRPSHARAGVTSDEYDTQDTDS